MNPEKSDENLIEFRKSLVTFIQRDENAPGAVFRRIRWVMDGLGIDEETASSEIARCIIEDQLERGIRSGKNLQEVRCRVAERLKGARPSQPGLLKPPSEESQRDEKPHPLRRIS